MRNPTLWCAIALGLGLAQPAEAVLRISPSGVGSAVYVPYYTVEEDRSSLLTVRNSHFAPTMVRVLFAEAQNGQNVLTFNVMLPAHSVWSGTVSAVGSSGGARLTSESAVCTLPNIGTGVFPFVPFDYANNHPDGGSTDIARTRSGAVEVIELGTLNGELGSAATALDCARVTAQYTVVSGVAPDRSEQILAPRGKISANLHVVSVSEGLVNTIEGIAIEGFSSSPQDVTGGDYLPRISTPLLEPGVGEFQVDGPGPYGRLLFAANRGPDAISSLFLNTELSGEFYTNPSLGATTEWVISMPTKHAYVSNRPGSLATPGVAAAPYSNFFDATGSCDSALTLEHRLGGSAQQEAGDPTGYESTELCAQVNLVTFEQPAFAAGSKRFFMNIGDRFIFARTEPDAPPFPLRGLPAIGIQFNNFINAQVQPNVLANYSITQALRGQPAERTFSPARLAD